LKLKLAYFGFEDANIAPKEHHEAFGERKAVLKVGFKNVKVSNTGFQLSKIRFATNAVDAFSVSRGVWRKICVYLSTPFRT